MPYKNFIKSISLQTVKQKLKKKGIEIRSRYKFPLYKQKVFQDLKIKSSQNYKKLYLKNAEKLSGRIFGLPNHYKLNKQKLNYIIKTLGNLFEKNKVEIIAEAGINHNGKFKNAIKLIKIAKMAKVDYVKFQLFNTENFINRKFDHHILNYNKIYKRFKNLEFSVDQWKKIIKFGKRKGIKVFFSIFDTNSLKNSQKIKSKFSQNSFGRNK